MTEALKDLSVSYPFLPGSTIPEEIMHIKDVRIVFELPAQTYKRDARNTLQFTAAFVSITPSMAIFNVKCEPFGIDENVQIPVTTGLYNLPVGNNYVLVDEPVTYAGHHELHPDCLIFFQKAPKLRVGARRNVTSSDTGVVDYYSFDKVISFADGNNVSVTGNSSQVIFTGGEGNGTGIWMSSPWVDIDGSSLKPAAGLRSINGKQENVAIVGSESVSIEGSGGIELVINPLPYPEEETP